MKKNNILVFFTIILLFSSPLKASVIKIGSLTSNDDGNSEIIVDSFNNREWLRWDVLANLNYTQTLSAISSSGGYSGWKMATLTDIGLFMNALFEPTINLCLPQSTNVRCGNPAGESVGNFISLLGNANTGNNWTYTLVEDPDHIDRAALLYMEGTNIIGGDPSSAEVSRGFGINRNWIELNNPFSSPNGSSRDIGFLLYRDVGSTTTVPEPAPVLILLMGIALLSATRIRCRI